VWLPSRVGYRPAQWDEVKTPAQLSMEVNLDLASRQCATSMLPPIRPAHRSHRGHAAGIAINTPEGWLLATREAMLYFGIDTRYWNDATTGSACLPGMMEVDREARTRSTCAINGS